MILIIDNYDSFTYNLVQYIGTIKPDLEVHRNDKITLDEIRNMNPERIVISPGPGKPEDAGLSIDVVKEFGESIPIFGICLGHQAITVAYGGMVDRANEIVHGKTSCITQAGSVIFNDIPENIHIEVLFDEESIIISNNENINAELQENIFKEFLIKVSVN